MFGFKSTRFPISAISLKASNPKLVLDIRNWFMTGEKKSGKQLSEWGWFEKVSAHLIGEKNGVHFRLLQKPLILMHSLFVHLHTHPRVIFCFISPKKQSNLIIPNSNLTWHLFNCISTRCWRRKCHFIIHFIYVLLNFWHHFTNSHVINF